MSSLPDSDIFGSWARSRSRTVRPEDATLKKLVTAWLKKSRSTSLELYRAAIDRCCIHDNTPRVLSKNGARPPGDGG